MRFKRTESYVQGWRGKTSRTPIVMGAQEIGSIRGQESAGSASMTYWIETIEHAFWDGFDTGRSFFSLKAAKDAVRAHAKAGWDAWRKWRRERERDRARLEQPEA